MCNICDLSKTADSDTLGDGTSGDSGEFGREISSVDWQRDLVGRCLQHHDCGECECDRDGSVLKNHWWRREWAVCYSWCVGAMGGWLIYGWMVMLDRLGWEIDLCWHAVLWMGFGFFFLEYACMNGICNSRKARLLWSRRWMFHQAFNSRKMLQTKKSIILTYSTYTVSIISLSIFIHSLAHLQLSIL